MYRNVINQTEDESQNYGSERRNGPVPLWCCFSSGHSLESPVIRQLPSVQDEENAIHVAETLVVFVNKFTLRAPFHATLLEWACVDGACGRWKLE